MFITRVLPLLLLAGCGEPFRPAMVETLLEQKRSEREAIAGFNACQDRCENLRPSVDQTEEMWAPFYKCNQDCNKLLPLEMSRNGC